MPYFGKHYAQEMFEWIKANYVFVQRIGDMPLVSEDKFGILFLKRRGSGY